MFEPALHVQVAANLLIAAALGTVIGIEREIHGHPAGMRTHLLVALGSALFTVLSIHGFVGVSGVEGEVVDPTRIAAQIVTGIGFLGAGAIIKEGFGVRGLTTAASLWATAAIGMAAGAGEPILAAFGTVVVGVSLWPLNQIATRINAARAGAAAITVDLDGLEALEAIEQAIEGAGAQIRSLDVRRGEGGRRTARLDLWLRDGATHIGVSRALLEVDGVAAVSTERPD